MKKKKIGELLVKDGIITDEQLTTALRKQKKEKKRLGEILIELEFITSANLVRMLSEQAAIPFVELRTQMLDEKLIKSFPERFLYENNIIPVYETEEKLSIAIGDPTNIVVRYKIMKYNTKQVELSGADPKQIVHLLDKYFLIDQTEQILKED